MDKITFRILLVCLSIFEVLLIIGSFYLLILSKDVPDFITTSAVAIITGILGLAVHTEPTIPVVQNNAGDNVVPVVADNGGVN